MANAAIVANMPRIMKMTLYTVIVKNGMVKPITPKVERMTNTPMTKTNKPTIAVVTDNGCGKSSRKASIIRKMAIAEMINGTKDPSRVVNNPGSPNASMPRLFNNGINPRAIRIIPAGKLIQDNVGCHPFL